MLGPLDLVLPPTVLLTAVATLPFTVLILPFTNPSAFTSLPLFKHYWFKHFWWWFGPASKPIFASTVRPLLEQASGIVLDIGPASGVWIKDLGEIVRKNPGKIKKIYGVEPNELFHEQIRANAKAYGLEGVYEPIAAYAGPELEKVKGIEEGSVDTILTVHVLCSVGSKENQEKIVRSLYEYVKPGGQWLVFEHVASKNAPVKIWQDLHNVVWAPMLDGCDLTKDTEKVLKEAVEWDEVELGPNPSDGQFECLPHTMGRLVKKR